MKKVYFTVGPSQIYPTIPKHLNEALKKDILSLNHRGKEFKKIYQDCAGNLKRLLTIPSNYQIFFVSSALESMERTIQGTVENCSFHIISGSFGKAWANYAQDLAKEVIRYEVDLSKKLNLGAIEIPQKAEVICITQNDTSTGFWVPPKQIQELKKQHPEKLVAIDVVSSVPYADINYKYIDITFFSVQKGFGLPAGLGVIIVSPQAIEKVEHLLKKNIIIGSYHSFKNLSQKAQDFQTPETPNVLNIYLLNKVAADMLKQGIKKIHQSTDQKAKLVYTFFDSHNKYTPFIKNTELRSPTTAVIDVKGESEKLRKKLQKKGFIVGAGYGDHKLNHIRIANFPSQTIKDTITLLKSI